MCDTDVATRVAFLGKLTGEKFVQFGAEDTIRNKLSLLADLSRHLRSWEELCMYTDELALYHLDVRSGIQHNANVIYAIRRMKYSSDCECCRTVDKATHLCQRERL